MSKSVKLFIVEGENRDYRFIQEMQAWFFRKEKSRAAIVNLPAGQNIYMLYKILKDDFFETDIVEVLRDQVPTAKEILNGISRQDIDEVFLFFDYDIHQDNIGTNDDTADSIVETMLDVFSNETENGKLYISYPMVEALYDYKESSCEAYSGCFVPVASIREYKHSSAYGNDYANHKMDIERWKQVLNAFSLRVACLFDAPSIEFEEYREKVSPATIYQREKKLKTEENKVFVLSAFPEFLFDYFKVDFWRSMTPRKRRLFEYCARM